MCLPEKKTELKKHLPKSNLDDSNNDSNLYLPFTFKDD